MFNQPPFLDESEYLKSKREEHRSLSCKNIEKLSDKRFWMNDEDMSEEEKLYFNGIYKKSFNNSLGKGLELLIPLQNYSQSTTSENIEAGKMPSGYLMVFDEKSKLSNFFTNEHKNIGEALLVFKVYSNVYPSKIQGLINDKVIDNCFKKDDRELCFSSYGFKIKDLKEGKPLKECTWLFKNFDPNEIKDENVWSPSLGESDKISLGYSEKTTSKYLSVLCNAKKSQEELNTIIKYIVDNVPDFGMGNFMKLPWYRLHLRNVKRIARHLAYKTSSILSLEIKNTLDLYFPENSTGIDSNYPIIGIEDHLEIFNVFEPINRVNVKNLLNEMNYSTSELIKKPPSSKGMKNYKKKLRANLEKSIKKIYTQEDLSSYSSKYVFYSKCSPNKLYSDNYNLMSKFKSSSGNNNQNINLILLGDGEMAILDHKERNGIPFIAVPTLSSKIYETDSNNNQSDEKQDNTTEISLDRILHKLVEANNKIDHILHGATEKKHHRYHGLDSHKKILSSMLGFPLNNQLERLEIIKPIFTKYSSTK